MPSKSIWRSDKAQHFQLVHRSQQDPLTYDAESSSRVLKPSITKKEQQRQAARNVASPQTRADLERELGDYAKNIRANVGEAAQYGIMFDDTEYDYMQHLRAVGDDYHKRRGGEDVEDDTEVIMLEAPKTSQVRAKGKMKDGNVVQLKEDVADRKEKERVIMQLPNEVLPSEVMMPRIFESEEEKGLRPDMDPHLRQVLEALEDDAFLMRTAKGGAAEEGEELAGDAEAEDFDIGDEEDIDDFFSGIVREGELGQKEDAEWRHLPPEGEESIYEDPGSKAARELMQLKALGGGVDDLSLESRVALFKKAQEEQQAEQATNGSMKRRVASSTGSQSIFGEKGANRRSRHPGAKARLAASYYAPSIEGGATAFSMSSSAMERNQGLTGLDEQFDRMEKIYEQESDEEGGELDEDEIPTETPADIDAIFDDFLNKNEIVGNRLRERLGDRQTTSSEKVDILRKELGEIRLIDKLSINEVDEDRESYDEIIMNDLKSRDAIRQEWDVQTVLTTRTNLENHPRTIASVTSHLPKSLAFSGVKLNGSIAGSTTSRMPKVRINPRTGVPEVTSHIDIEARNRQKQQHSSDSNPKDGKDYHSDGDESDASSADPEVPPNITITRPRNESKEEKKARKEAVKDQKRSKRAEKSARKQMYETELNKQKRAMGSAGVVQHATAVRLS